MNTIVNGAPMMYTRGTQDNSVPAQVVEPEDLPTHLAHTFGFAKWGPAGDPQLVVGGSRTLMFGADSFDLRKKYATHATVLSNTINSQGNSQMFERLQPEDAGPPASLRLWLDLLPMQVPLYERNTDGSYKKDEDGLLIPAGSTVAGFKAKFVVTEITHTPPTTPGDPAEDDFGIATMKPGDQTDVPSSTQSNRYPLQDFQVPFFGADGRNYGLRLWTEHVNSQRGLDISLLTDSRVYPFNLACVKRADLLSSPEIVETVDAVQSVEATLREGTLNRKTDQMIFVGDNFVQAYQDLDNPNNPPQWGPFGKMHVYTNQIETILDLVNAAEYAVGDAADLTGESEDKYLFNLFGGHDSNGRPYDSFLLLSNLPNPPANAARLRENSTLYAIGGSDGTMNETVLADLVSKSIAKYANPNSVLQDIAKYPQSIVYDSGFPLQTKMDLAQVMAYRKDMFVMLSTHDVLGAVMTPSQDNSIAVALRTHLQNYPESEYFGTSVCRGMVVGRSGRLLNSQYTKRLPLTIELARKSAAYMGAGDGRWKPGFSFDSGALAVIDMFTDVSAPFTPATVRYKDWDAGLVTPQTFQRRSLYFPALKTVYDKDASVLNSFFTAMLICELVKVGDRVHKSFSGTDRLTNLQIKERVEAKVRELTDGRFDDRYVIVPNCYFTAADIARGYSYTLRINFYAANMKTVQTLEMGAYRLDDLPSNQGGTGAIAAV